MLSVGREIGIAGGEAYCRECGWEGIGSQLATGLASLVGGAVFLYAYRCPRCHAFEVSRKGKLLPFRPRGEGTHRTETDRADVGTRNRFSSGKGGATSKWK